jgi:hypothetical protein
MERRFHKYQDVNRAKVIGHQLLLEAIVFSLLNKDFATRGHCVCVVPARVVGNFYGLTVGGERVSGKDLITVFIAGAPGPQLSGVVLPGELVDHYLEQPGMQQDKYATCLLVAVAFFKAVVLQHETSAGVVTE